MKRADAPEGCGFGLIIVMPSLVTLIAFWAGLRGWPLGLLQIALMFVGLWLHKKADPDLS